jgi:hypothetical protein
VRKGEDEEEKNIRKNKIKKRWIRKEGVVYVSKRGRVLEICRERKEYKIYLFILNFYYFKKLM